MGRRIAYTGTMAAMVVWLGVLGAARPAGAQVTIPADQREEVERRVEEMEAQMRSIRDQKIARCRGQWTLCSNKRCKRIDVSDADRWQTCQDACDAELERCQAVAYEYWPEGE